MTQSSNSATFLVVGVGASAGGVEALRAFFAHVSADSGVAYVVILHLSPDYDSQLAAVLQTVASIPVTQITEQVHIEPNHVYVVPPNQHLLMVDGQIAVSPSIQIEERRAPVDIFFRTLAESHRAQAVAVVLSGTGANGSMGLKRVKERGGAVFVQNPREAAWSEMPRNAIATDLVDEVLPVAEIPGKIVAYGARLGTVAIPIEAEARPEEEQQALREVFGQLRARTGHDFSNYKRPTLLRRIERRVSVRSLPSLSAYAVFLREHPEETQALLKDLLISVTNFFRDTAAFETIEHEIIPQIVRGKRGEDVVRVWVIGCATGEEAYSLAILCAERTLDVIDAPRIQIFASDIDEAALAKAREGVYTLNDVADVSPERLRRFFAKEGDHFRVNRELRDLVLFANHNVLKDPPFGRIDLVTCRNMLIYLNNTAQKRVIETIHFALLPGGYLFLGSSESVDGSTDLFALVSREHHIFQSRTVGMRPLPMLELAPALPQQPRRLADVPLESGTQPRDRVSYGELHTQLLERYAPPSIVVNEDYDIVHVSEHAGRFLQVAGGEPSANLLKLIRPELRFELRTALYQAVQHRTNVEVKNRTLQIGDRTETITMLVRPALRDGDPASGFVLIVFEPSTGETNEAETLIASDEPVVQQLEEEVARLKAQLRASNEQHDVQAEELKASNEELQALNEELRSAAEELETSREELQSINEELRTVNQELKVKVEEITNARNNLQNLINSTDIGTIFLDRSFRVALFTPAAREIFNLIGADYGRPLSDITHRLVATDVVADADVVLAKLQPIEREVRTTDGRDFSMRLLPYRTSDDRIGGVVVTFLDITERRRAEQTTFYLASIVESSEDSMLTVNFDGIITSWNKASEHLYGYSAREAIGKPLTMLTLPEDLWQVVRNAERIKDSQKVEVYDTIRINKDGREMNLEVVLSPVRDAAGQVIGVSTIARDVTERRQAEEALRESEARFRTLTDAVPHVIWANEAGGKANYFNERWFSYSGKSFEESFGLGWQVIVHPDDAPASVERWNQALASGTIFDTEYRLRRADGEYRWFISRNVPLHDDAGRVLGWFGSATDIHDLKNAEAAVREAAERLQIAIEVAQMGTWDWNLERGEVYWNERHFHLFGMQPTTEPLTPEAFFAHIHPDDRQEVTNRLERAVNELVVFEAEFRAVRDDGAVRWMSGYGQAVETVGGKATRMSGVMLDITERKQTAEALQRANQELEMRVEERTASLTDANATLQKEIAQRKQVEAQREVLLQRIIRAQEDERQRIARELHDSLGQYLSALNIRLSIVQSRDGFPPVVGEEIGQLRELASQIDDEVDRLTMELRPPSLDSLGLLGALRSYAEEWSTTSSIPLEVLAIGEDEMQLPPAIESTAYRVVQEALTNVLKHAQATNVSVIIERRASELRVIIEDDGVGFDAASGTGTGAGGRHMGLIGMTERAILTGGELNIESEAGKGTTIYLLIPLANNDTTGTAAEPLTTA